MNSKMIHRLNSLVLLAILFTLSGCARNATIGMKPHQFSSKAKHILWVQVDGLLAEHLPLIKYDKEGAKELTSFEKMACTGTLWSYNLFDLRPKNGLGFIGQVLGSKNTVGKCEDIDRAPLWSYYQDKEYAVGIFESEGMVEGKQNFSIDRYSSCTENVDILKDVFLWKREGGQKGVSLFHQQEGTGLKNPGVYFDKSCHDGSCFESFMTNIRVMWKSFTAKNAKTFTVIRDKRYSNLLKKRDILSAKQVLEQWDDFLIEAQEKMATESISIVVSTSSGLTLEFPKRGNSWRSFMKKGNNVTYGNTSLTSSLWAVGAGAENFCGTYDESQVYKRFLWLPDKTLFDKVSF